MTGICLMGVDPGVSGALAFYFPARPERVAVYDMPAVDKEVNAVGVQKLIRDFRPVGAVVELVGARPGQGVSSMFKFGLAFGVVRGVIAAESVPMIFVTPAKWKKHFSLNADKEKSRALALQTWPVCGDAFSRVKDDGRAEAALLARYAADVAFVNLVQREGLFA